MLLHHAAFAMPKGRMQTSKSSKPKTAAPTYHIRPNISGSCDSDVKLGSPTIMRKARAFDKKGLLTAMVSGMALDTACCCRSVKTSPRDESFQGILSAIVHTCSMLLEYLPTMGSIFGLMLAHIPYLELAWGMSMSGEVGGDKPPKCG